MADSLIIKIDGDSKGYQREFNKVKDGVQELNKIAKALTVATVAAGTAIVGMGVKYNAEMEQYKAGFATMLGSAEKADKTISDLKSFAAKTPFEMTDLANASTTLLAFGEDAEDLMGDLKTLGDISLGNSEKFKSLALVYGQVQSQGRLMGQDLLQMINSGFNPLLVISEKTGKSMATLKDEMAQGKITFEMVAEAMKTATAEGGQFYNAMESQSKTLTGQFSTLKDNITALFGEISSDLSESLSEDVMPWLIEQVEDLNQAWEEGRLQEYIKGAAVVLSAFGAAVISLNTAMFINDIYSMAKGVEGFTAATKLGTSAQKLLNLELLKNPYTLAAMALATLVAGVVAYHTTHKSVAAELVETIDSISESHSEAKKQIDETTKSAIAEAEKANLLKERLFDLDQQVKNGILTDKEAEIAKEKLKTVAEELCEIVPDLTIEIDNESGALKTQISTIDTLVNSYVRLAKAKAMATAYQSKINETAKAIADLEEEKSRLEPVSLAEALTLSPDDERLKNDPLTSMRATAKIDREIQKLNSEMDGYISKLSEYQKEVQENKLETDDNTRKTTSSDVPGTSGTAREKQTSLYQKAVEKELDTEERKYRTLRYLGKISQKEYLANVAQRAEKYRTYATDVVNQESLSAEERYSIQGQWLRKAMELEETILEDQKKSGVISQREYWEKLAEMRDKHFAEGSDAWLEYSQKIVELQKEEITKTYTEIAEAAESSFEEIANAQNALENKLKSLGTILKEVTITGGGMDGTYNLLRDFERENEAILAYSDALEKLKERGKDLLGDDFSKFFNQFSEMSVEEGIEAVNMLLSATDSHFNEVIGGWKDYQRNSEEFASNFYKNDYEILREETIEALEEAFGTVPETFIENGEMVAEAFGEGFMSRIHTVFDGIEKAIDREMSRIMPQLSISNNSSNIGSVPNNTYNSTYVLSSRKETVAEQLQSARNYEIIKKLRGGYDF